MCRCFTCPFLSSIRFTKSIKIILKKTSPYRNVFSNIIVSLTSAAAQSSAHPHPFCCRKNGKPTIFRSELTISYREKGKKSHNPEVNRAAITTPTYSKANRATATMPTHHGANRATATTPALSPPMVPFNSLSRTKSNFCPTIKNKKFEFCVL